MATALPSFSPQTPSDRLDNTFDMTLVIPAGDHISSAEVATTMATMIVDGVSVAGALVTAWVTGGTPRQTATLTCTVTTANGRIFHRSATMDILATR